MLLPLLIREMVTCNSGITCSKYQHRSLPAVRESLSSSYKSSCNLWSCDFLRGSVSSLQEPSPSVGPTISLSRLQCFLSYVSLLSYAVISQHCCALLSCGCIASYEYIIQVHNGFLHFRHSKCSNFQESSDSLDGQSESFCFFRFSAADVLSMGRVSNTTR